MNKSITLHSIIIIIIVLLPLGNSSAQTLWDINEKYRIKAQCAPTPSVIEITNEVTEYLGRTDMITGDFLYSGATYYYRGAPINSWQYQGEKSDLWVMKMLNAKTDPIIDYHSTYYQGRRLFSLLAYLPLDNNMAYVYELGSNGNKDGVRLLHYETIDGQKSGQYNIVNNDGILLTQGQYCLIDSSYTDTITVFSSETYEQSVFVIDYDKASVKHGVWKHFNSEGVFKREEIFHSSCE